VGGALDIGLKPIVGVRDGEVELGIVEGQPDIVTKPATQLK